MLVPSRASARCLGHSGTAIWLPTRVPPKSSTPFEEQLFEHLTKKGQQRLFPCFFASAQLRLSAFAVGRNVELVPLTQKECIPDRFPALGLQLRRHQPPTQEKRLCCRLAVDTDVDVSFWVAVGTLVACDSFDQVLTCHCALACRSPQDAPVLAVNKTSSSITNVSWGTGATVTAFVSTFGGRSTNIVSSDLLVASWKFRPLWWKLRFWEVWGPGPKGRLWRGYACRTCLVPSGRRCVGCATRITATKANIVDRAWLFPANSLRADFDRPPLFGLRFTWHAGGKNWHLALRVDSRQHKRARKVKRVSEGAKFRAHVLVSRSIFLRAASFSLCTANSAVLLAKLRWPLVQVFLCFFFSVEERLEEVCFQPSQPTPPPTTFYSMAWLILMAENR